MTETIELQIWRQPRTEIPGDWERFLVSVGPEATVLDALRQINENCTNADGAKTTPIAFGDGDEGDGGKAGLNINGKPSLAGESQLADCTHPVMLTPFTTFPLVRDLQVNQGQLKRDLSRAGELAPSSVHEVGVPAECVGCGVCHEACSEYQVKADDEENAYMGPAPIMLLDLANQAPDGIAFHGERMELLMGERGVIHDSNTFTYAEVCPRGLDLLGSMTRAKRQTTVRWLASLFQD